MTDIEIYVSDFLAEAKVDYVGLWQIVHSIGEDIGYHQKKEIRRLSLDVVQKLISRGLMPGDYTKEGFTFWGGSDEALLRRVADEWDALPDGMPNLGDSSCWFSFRP